MKKILIATHNPAKFNEYKRYLADLPLEVVSLKDLKIKTDVTEDGKTFEENAIKKVKFYSQLTGLPAITDDGGLAIDALGGQPGVKSRRWLGYKMTDEEMISAVMKKMAGVPKEKRTCQLVGVIALFIPPDKVYTQKAEIKGLVALKPTSKRIFGYPYRSFFWLPQFKKYYCELTKAEHEQVNHRKIALIPLKKIIKKS